MQSGLCRPSQVCTAAMAADRPETWPPGGSAEIGHLLLLAEGTGTLINFASLGGETSDIRLFPPRSLTLKGVVLGSWMEQPPEQRDAEVALAQRLAREPGTLFEVAERYPPSRVADAIRHVGQAG